MKAKSTFNTLLAIVCGISPIFLLREPASALVIFNGYQVSKATKAAVNEKINTIDNFREHGDVQIQGDKDTIALQTNFKVSLVSVVEEEWNSFGRQTLRSNQILSWGLQETTPTASQRIGEYWSFLGYSYTGENRDEYWSAAFISWAMNEAGNRVYQSIPFNYHRSHSVYIVDSIENRKRGNTNAGFVGYQIQEHAPEPGDLVCYSRASFVTYDTTGRYSAHCDVVTAKRNDEIEVIGGNVRDSVSKKILGIDSRGMLNDRAYPWFVVIKNNL